MSEKLTDEAVLAKLGRPTKYRPEYCERVIEMGKKGYHFYEMAMELEVDTDTFYEWCKNYPAFSLSYSRAKQYGKAYLAREARENMGNRDFHAKVLEWNSKFHNDFREAPSVRVDGFNDVDSYADKGRKVLDSLGNGEISCEEAKLIAETLKTLMTVNNESELGPIIDEIKAKLAEHKQ